MLRCGHKETFGGNGMFITLLVVMVSEWIHRFKLIKSYSFGYNNYTSVKLFLRKEGRKK